jgi:hypothetical protein
MRFIRFGGLVIVAYTLVGYLRSFGGGCCGISMPGGLEFAFLVSLQVLAAALIVSLGALVWRVPSPQRHGPGLEGAVGGTVPEQNCGPMEFAAAESDTVGQDSRGVPPVMPTYAGQLDRTEHHHELVDTISVSAQTRRECA